MAISLTISGNAIEVIREMQAFLQSRPAPANLAQPATAPQAEPAPPADKKPGTRKKAPAADAVLEQTPIEQYIAASEAAETTDGPQLTIDDARERVRKFHAAGHMDESVKVLEHFKIKKLSDADPDAGGKPSAKFGAVIAYYQSLVDAKTAEQG